MKSLKSLQIMFFFLLLPFSKAEPTGPVSDVSDRSGHQHAEGP